MELSHNQGAVVVVIVW